MSWMSRSALAVGTAVVVAGCGGGGDAFEDKSLTEITSATSADMKKVESLHMAGDLTSDSQKITLDISVTTDGDCEGTVALGDGQAEVRSTGGEAWMRPNDTFWEEQAPGQAAAIEQAVGDKWVVVPSDSQIDSFCDLDSFLDSFDDDSDSSDGPSENEGVESVGGIDAVKVSGKNKDGQQQAAWVAVDDPHHLLKFELGEGGDTTGTVTFTEFDDPVDVQKPADSDVVDLSTLGG